MKTDNKIVFEFYKIKSIPDIVVQAFRNKDYKDALSLLNYEERSFQRINCLIDKSINIKLVSSIKKILPEKFEDINYAKETIIGKMKNEKNI